jgi:hypothetical protein
MSRKTLSMAGLLSCLLLVRGANAGDLAGDASIGTTGLGLHASILLETDINARLGVNYMKLSTIMQDTDGDTNVDTALNTLDALLDWFPHKNAFHLTGGLVYNGNKIDTVTRLNGVTYKGTTFSLPLGTSLGEVDGKFNVGNIISPYIGIGWGNVLTHTSGWGITSDIGLLFHGKPQITLSSNGCTAGPACVALVAKVANEETRLNDEYAGKIVYPVARIGASYKF